MMFNCNYSSPLSLTLFSSFPKSQPLNASFFIFYISVKKKKKVLGHFCGQFLCVCVFQNDELSVTRKIYKFSLAWLCARSHSLVKTSPLDLDGTSWKKRECVACGWQCWKKLHLETWAWFPHCAVTQTHAVSIYLFTTVTSAKNKQVDFLQRFVA